MKITDEEVLSKVNSIDLPHGKAYYIDYNDMNAVRLYIIEVDNIPHSKSVKLVKEMVERYKKLLNEKQ